MTILIFTPVWRRPEILKIFLKGQEYLKTEAKKRNIELILFCIISPEDPFHKIIKKMLENEAVIFEYKNDPLGEKKNAGLHKAKELKFDYIMEVGSDNLINPLIFDLYQPYLIRDISYIGIKNLYILNWYSKICLFLRDYNEGHPIGPGRMLNKSILKINELWPSEANDSLDCESGQKLRKIGINEIALETGEMPYILDIKTNTNIWHWTHASSMAEKQVNFRDISNNFGINLYDESILEYQENKGFQNLYKEFLSFGYNKNQAYEETERNYELYFGKRKFKNYESFRVSKSEHNNPLFKGSGLA